MTMSPQPSTIHDRRHLLPYSEQWEDAEIVLTVTDPDGTRQAIMTLGHSDYWVRTYRAENGVVRFQFRAGPCRDAEEAFLCYIDSSAERTAG